MQLELDQSTGVEGEVSRIVRPSTKLINQQATLARHEKLDTENADKIERLHHFAPDLRRLGGDCRRHLGRRDRHVKKVMAMLVVDGAEVRPGAIDTPRADHGDLAIEIDKRFDDRLLTAQRVPRIERIAVASDRPLALSVVPEGRGFEDGRTSDLPYAGGELGFAAHGRKGRDRQPT